MAAPGANIRFMGVDSTLVDIVEKKSTRGNNKTEYFSLSDVNTNLATENLTQDAEARSYDTNGQSLEFTTDTGGYAESWFVIQSSRAELGFENTWHRYTSTELKNYANSINTTTLKSDGEYYRNVTAPTAADTDTYVQYATDIVAGNSAPHFKTENGDVIKLYAQDNTVSASGFVANTSGISDDTATWGGFTIGQVVKALLNAGLLK